MPGVVGILTGEDLAADKVGGLICGWMIHSKDGTPMKAGAHPALAQGKVRYVGDHVAVVIAETWPRPRTPPRPSRSITTCCPPWSRRRRPRAPARWCTTSPRTTPSSTGISATRRTSRRPSPRAAHVTKLDIVNNRLVPNPIEPARVGEYDEAEEAFTLYTTSQNPHVARLVLSAFIGIARRTS